MNTPTPQSASPYEEWVDSPSPEQRNPINHPGISLRDYFAAHIIGHLSASPMRKEFSAEDDAHYAYRVADAMMKESTNA